MRCKLLLTSLLLLAAAFSITGLGGWKPIKDLNDPYIQEIANLAVTEYDRRSKVSLVLVSMKSSESQVVKGSVYHLIISATNGTTTADYDAIVPDKLDHSRELTSFKPVKS
ncbi:cysteine proteinase inhibitor 1-like [Punica granatum]|uniref:Cysteine proteinase inhibitor 1-like n=2 Tax=Punica granatum TaxID=22663 RepID=A0A6P8EG11_PUNGR|nr:cysteine proteinase inhibitor 1-like [Punica granatum]PKI46548.1 hypothetical protein CRG98_033105 [Punica granatum]